MPVPHFPTSTTGYLPHLPDALHPLHAYTTRVTVAASFPDLPGLPLPYVALRFGLPHGCATHLTFIYRFATDDAFTYGCCRTTHDAVTTFTRPLHRHRTRILFIWFGYGRTVYAGFVICWVVITLCCVTGHYRL